MAMAKIKARLCIAVMEMVHKLRAARLISEKMCNKIFLKYARKSSEYIHILIESRSG